MSYDINLVNCDEKEVYDDNYTYNVASMFRDAIGGEGLYELYGKSAKDCLLLLKDSIVKMKSNPKHYEDMNPENGWGDYKGALKVLERLYNACVENLDSKVIIS